MRNVWPLLFLAWIVPIVTAQTGSTHPNTVNAQNIDDLGLVAPATGWTLADGRLFWTSTDGEQWSELIPAQGSQIDGVFFLDTQKGWVVLSGGAQIDARLQISVASTQDGGITWRVSPAQLTESRRYLRKASVFFLDGNDGWLTLRLASSSNFSFGLMLATHDGGKTWEQLPDPPAADPVYFATPAAGWIAGGPAGDQLWATRDGGTSWTPQHLDPPEACPDCKMIFQRPKFQSSLAGLLPAVLSAENRLMTVAYHTSDGGASWVPESLREENSGSMHAGPSVVVGSHALMVVVAQNRMSVVSDTGKAITAAAPAALPPAGNITHISFSGESNGWIVYASGTCAEFKSRCSQESALLSTSDGGASFKIITPVGSSMERISAPIGDAATTSPRSTRISDNSPAEVSQAEGFDIACAVSAPDMLTWWEYSPYYDVGVYLGGSNVTCKRNTYLNSTWVSSVSGMGWGIIPLWVGLQSPCKKMKTDEFWTISETIPYNEGQWEADDAVAAASSLGMSDSMIYFDMEYYPPGTNLKDGTACSPLVVQFLQGWADELHSNGYAAGLYGSLGDWWTTSGGAQDFIQLSGQIDAVWIADDDSSNDTVWNIGGLPNSYWSNNQRIHQYILGEASETWGGLPLGTLDRDVEDAPVFAWSGDRNLPAPTLQTPPNGSSGAVTTPAFTWTAITGATSYGGSGYSIMVATDPSMLPTDASNSSCPSCTISYPSPSDPNLMTNSYTPPAGVLQAGMTYWWQVQARPQMPKLGDWSGQFQLSTGTLATTIQTLSLEPATIGGGSYIVVTAALNGLAPSGSAVAALQSSSSLLPLPSYVKIAAGQTSGSVRVQVGTVNSSTTLTVTATYRGIQTASLTILPSVVTVTTTAAVVSGSSAVLNGTVNPTGASGYYGFEWGTDPTMASPSLSCYSLTYYPPYSCPAWATNSTQQSLSYSLTGLPNSTAYYYRLVGWDADNQTFQYGAIISFITGKPPIVKTTAASTTGSGAVLKGTVNPLGANGYYGFEWGTDPMLSSPSLSCYSLTYYPPYSCPAWTTNSTQQSLSYSLSDLPSSTTYYYRLVGWDADNQSFQYGAIASFTTGKAPVVTTTAARNVTGSSAVMWGTVDPLGANGYYGFEWGTDPTLSSPSLSCYSLTYYPPYSCPAWTTNSTQQFLSYSLSDLPSSTTYYYRLVGWDADNQSFQYGAIVSFTTGKPPVVKTAAAGNVTESAAVISGTINPLGANGYFGFEWGLDATLSSPNLSCYSLTYYPPYSCPAWTTNSTQQSFTYSLTGLSSMTKYYYRVVGWDADNSSYSYGAILSFTTQ